MKLTWDPLIYFDSRLIQHLNLHSSVPSFFLTLGSVGPRKTGAAPGRNDTTGVKARSPSVNGNSMEKTRSPYLVGPNHNTASGVRLSAPRQNKDVVVSGGKKSSFQNGNILSSRTIISYFQKLVLMIEPHDREGIIYICLGYHIRLPACLSRLNKQL